MADPLSIASGALAVITAAKKTGDAIYNFIRDCKEARTDLSQITRELSELSLILELIKDENAAATKGCLPDALQTQVQAMLTSCTTTVQQVDKTLAKCRGKSGPLRWTMVEKDKAMTLKGSLEAFKSGLSLALETVNLSMTREIKHTTETIQDHTAEIKRDTSEILDEIYKLRDQLPPSLPSDPERLRLEHWLDNLTHYAETIVADEDGEEVSEAASLSEHSEEQNESDDEAIGQPSASTTPVHRSNTPINLNKATQASRQLPLSSPRQVASPARDNNPSVAYPTRGQGSSAYPTRDDSYPTAKQLPVPTFRANNRQHDQIPYHVISSVPCSSRIIYDVYCMARETWATLHEDRVLRFWSLLTGKLLMSLPVFRENPCRLDEDGMKLTDHNTFIQFCPARPGLILVVIDHCLLKVWKWDEGARIRIGPDVQRMLTKNAQSRARFIPESTLIYAINSRGQLVIVDILKPLTFQQISLRKLGGLPHAAPTMKGYRFKMIWFISEREILILWTFPRVTEFSFSRPFMPKKSLEHPLWEVTIFRLPLTPNDENRQVAPVSTKYSDAVIEGASVTAQFEIRQGFISITRISLDNDTRSLIVAGKQLQERKAGRVKNTVVAIRAVCIIDMLTGALVSQWHTAGRKMVIKCPYEYGILYDPISHNTDGGEFLRTSSDRSISSRYIKEESRRNDSGHESAHSSSQHRLRTPEEQAAHDRRKEERRARRELDRERDREQERDCKSEEAETTPTSERQSPRYLRPSGFPTYGLVVCKDGRHLGTIAKSWNAVVLESNKLALWRHVGSDIEFAMTDVSLDELPGQ
ncbi:hypothetical protein GGR55DRAFT_613714 [Xylaria sp. FL0064]|nr:hypothetical protein GGR55DRAFT_613714 [Xylaria sp. FL0064]